MFNLNLMKRKKTRKVQNVEQSTRQDISKINHCENILKNNVGSEIGKDSYKGDFGKNGKI